MCKRNYSPTPCVLLCAAITIILIAPPARAQKDAPIETIKRYPLDLLNKSSVELGRRGLRWQIERAEMEQRALQRDIEILRAQIDDHQSKVESISSKKPAELRFASDAVREQLIRQALQKLFDARVDIAANEALIEKLEQKLKEFQSNETEKKRFEVRENMLREQIQLLGEKVRILEQLVRKRHGANTQLDLVESRVRIKGLEGELEELGFEKELSRQRSAAEAAVRLANARLETHQLKAREKAAQLQLSQLAKTAQIDYSLRQDKQKIDHLVERLKLRIARHEQALMEVEKTKLLLKQIERAIKEGVQRGDFKESEK